MAGLSSHARSGPLKINRCPSNAALVAQYPEPAPRWAACAEQAPQTGSNVPKLSRGAA